LIGLALVIATGSVSLAAGERLWVQRFGAADSPDDPADAVVSPDGSTVFVTGTSSGLGGWVTIAYDATDGTQRWLKRFEGPAKEDDFAEGIAVTPDGSVVLVTGNTSTDTGVLRIATVAYDSATGAVVWKRFYGPSENNNSESTTVAVAPDGSVAYVTGHTSYDFFTRAYDVATGERVWTTTHDGQAHGDDVAIDLEVGPRGNRVYVTGFSSPAQGSARYDTQTIAYAASDGRRLWASRYAGPSDGREYPVDLDVTPDGSTVIVAQLSKDADVLAYAAAGGALRWKHAITKGSASQVAVSPDGGVVYLTGSKLGSAPDYDYLTIAYDTASGAQIWSRRYSFGSGTYDAANAIAVDPIDGTVIVTGTSWATTSFPSADVATIAHDGATGTRDWLRRYDGPANDYDEGVVVVASPDGSRVFVIGRSWSESNVPDYVTVAYAN
jgi:WD40 repeat protein